MSKQVLRFNYKGRICVIRHVFPASANFHCGYVSTKHYGKHYDEYMGINCEEPTYGDQLTKPEKVWYIGFDSGHSHDTPLTQSIQAVYDRTLIFADQLIELEKCWEESK